VTSALPACAAAGPYQFTNLPPHVAFFSILCSLQGNALGRGPLVLHLPMRLLATIRQRAAAALPAATAAAAAQLSPAGLQDYDPPSFSSTAGAIGGTAGSTAGDAVGGTEPSSMNAAAFAQLLLDMHRQAGLMLLDRMGDSVVQHMAAHVEVAVQVGSSVVFDLQFVLLVGV
jgi:hypothetical protein